METVGVDAAPRGALPPVAAGDAAVLQVAREVESPWKRRSDISQQEELTGLTAEKSDLQMTLM